MTRGFFDLFSGELRDLNIENMSGVNTNLATEYTFIKELRRGKLVNVHVTGLQVDFTSGDEIISHAIGGLVNTLYGGTIEDSSISGNMNGIHHGAGGMVGKAREDRVSCDSTLQNCVSKVNMNTDAGRIVGGLVGSASYTNVTNSYSTGTVTGLTQVGGLIGSFGFGEIVGSSASGNVSGTISVGGLVGVLGNATLTTSGASGSVTSSGGDKAGGLVGRMSAGNSLRCEISQSFATGPVRHLEDESAYHHQFFGGFVGQIYSSNGGTNHVDDSFATGATTGDNFVGGLVGGVQGVATIRRSFSTGLVTSRPELCCGNHAVGGLAGGTHLAGSSLFQNGAFWDTATSGQEDSATGRGLATEHLKSFEPWFSAAGYDFDSIWQIPVNGGYATLRQATILPRH